MATTMRSYGSGGKPPVKRLHGRDGRFVQGGAGYAILGVDAVLNRFEQLADQADENRRQYAERLRDDMELYMKENAPWTDETGDARRELQATVVHDSPEGVSSVHLMHGVYYGVYLEYANGGAYAILWPTALHFAEAGELATNFRVLT